MANQSNAMTVVSDKNTNTKKVENRMNKQMVKAQNQIAKKEVKLTEAAKERDSLNQETMKRMYSDKAIPANIARSLLSIYNQPLSATLERTVDLASKLIRFGLLKKAVFSEKTGTLIFGENLTKSGIAFLVRYLAADPHFSFRAENLPKLVKTWADGSSSLRTQVKEAFSHAKAHQVIY